MKTFVLMMVSLLFAISSEAQNKSFYDFTVKTIDGKAKMFPGTGAGPCDASRFTGTTSSGAYLLTNVINNLPK